MRTAAVLLQYPMLIALPQYGNSALGLCTISAEQLTLPQQKFCQNATRHLFASDSQPSFLPFSAAVEVVVVVVLEEVRIATESTAQGSHS